jgi:hypothetical protein
LFAVLAGVGVALSTGGPRRPPDARAHLAAAAGLAVRGILVGLVGLWLVGFDGPIAVILPYYGLLFVVAIPLLRLPPAALGAGALLACALTPVASHLLRAGLPPGPGQQAGLSSLADPAGLVVTLGLTGYYPALTWTTYLLAGMAVGRLDLRRPALAAALLVGGSVLAVLAVTVSDRLMGPGGGAAAVGGAELHQRQYGTTPTDTWWWLAIDDPHSGTPFDHATTTGTALAVLGAMLLLARGARWLVLLPAALGAVPLTLYTMHVIAVAAYAGNGSDDAIVWLVHVLAATAIGVALWLAGLRGPLEAAVGQAVRSVRRLVDPRPSPASREIRARDSGDLAGPAGVP